MSEILDEVATLLRTSDILSQRADTIDRQVLIFEGKTVIGFVLHYELTATLLARWQGDLDALISKYQFSLRRADRKAWNTYAVLLADGPATRTEQALLDMIEEDLVGTRKIARVVLGVADVNAAVLPLLPLQHAPRLEAIDVKSEIRLRTKGLETDLVDAFLSDAPESLVLRMLEDAS